MRPSIEHDAIRVPSWLKVTAVTGSECAGRVFKVLPALCSISNTICTTWKHTPRATSHTLTVSSNPPDANKLDEGLKFTQKTKFVWPSMTFDSSYYTPGLLSASRNSECGSTLTVSRFHSRTDLSSDADARNSPFTDQATSEMPSVCPSNVWMMSPVSESHSLTSLSAAYFRWCMSTHSEQGARIEENSPQDASMLPSGLNFTEDMDRE